MGLSRPFSQLWRFLNFKELGPKSSNFYSHLPVLRNEIKLVRLRSYCYSSVSSRNYCQSAGLSLKNPGVQKYILQLAEDENSRRFRTNPDFKKIVTEISQRLSDLQELRVLAEQEDFRDAAAKDVEALEKELKELEVEFFDSVLEPEPLDHNDVVIEVGAGVGGQEAMLFALELFQMYQNFAAYNDLEFTITKLDSTDIGGLRHGIATISGSGAYYHLKFEGGVHRVQRIPKTEKSGRIHTSTATVAILALPTDIQVVINLSDLKYEAKKASGAGGQHVNTTESAIRLTHVPTGIIVECQMERSQIQNRELALKMLRAQIYEKKLQSQTSKTQQSRKLQQGLGTRSEKIRTYNYVQDRVTDHRIGLSVFNLKGVLEGRNYLDDLATKLHDYDNQERITQLFSDA